MTITKSRGLIRTPALRRRAAEPIAAIFKSGPSDLSLLAQQHHALRRAATLVARGASPAKVFSSVADELARCLNADTAAMFRFETDGTVVLLGGHTIEPDTMAVVGRGMTLEADGIAAMALRDGRRARMETHENVARAVAARLRHLGVQSPIVAPIIVENRAWGVLVVGSSRGEALPQQAESWVKDLADLVATAIANAAAREELQASRDNLRALATQQEALRRLATLVARGAGPEECFAAVATEMARCLEVEKAELFRYEDDGGAIAVACHASPGTNHLAIGERITPEDHKVAAALLRTGFAAATDGREDTAGSVGARLRELGFGSVAGAPILVDGRLWGLAVVGSTRTKRLPPDTKQRIAEFADLAATAIAASTTRADLIASRARIVAASDEARRRLERDLHDGAQQRLVSLRLKLRAAVTNVPDELDGLKNVLANVASDLTDVTTELQEISRGIHPAVLSKGGLAPALRALANRSAIPAKVDVAIERPVPDPVEVGAYYIVAEALTNAAKHSHATEVIVSAHDEGANLYLSVTDNGIGGANAGKGSGLVGLNDRVEALGGKMTITSIPGSGTSLNVTIPVSTVQSAWSSSLARSGEAGFLSQV
jgi:signal transduction histidine kinase